MSNQEDDLITSDWIEHPLTAEQYTEMLEETRNLVGIPVRVCYMAIADTYIPHDGNVLSLGIGTGQVEEMMGIIGGRLIGVDLNASFLETTALRLPEATLIHTEISSALEGIDHIPLVMLNDVLDTINPKRLPSLLRQLRDKTDKVIITHFFSPDPLFYAFHSSRSDDGSRGGPSIEGWLPEQQALITNYLNIRGITFPLKASELIHVLDDFLMAEGFQLQVTLTDAFQRTKFFDDILRTTIKDISDLSRFLYALTTSSMQYRSAPINIEPPVNTLLAKRFSMHALVKFIKSYCQIRFCLLLEEDALKQAGFSVTHEQFAANRIRKISRDDITLYLNRGLSPLMTLYVGRPDPRNIAGKGMMFGSFWQTYEPQADPFLLATVSCLVVS